jgi:urease accessory protein
VDGATVCLGLQRAFGEVSVLVKQRDGHSALDGLRQAGCLKARFPRRDDLAWMNIVTLNTSGGIAGGDQLNSSFAIGAGARATITSQAAERFYRALPASDPSCVYNRITVAAGGAAEWLPQETILFDRARLRRTIDLDLAADASVLLAEATVFGRSAMGEAVAYGHLLDRWRVRVAGALVLADTIRLDGAIAQCLAESAVAAESAAVASVLKIPGNDEAVAAIRAMQQRFIGDVGVSTWNGLALARLVACDGAALRHDLISVLTTWGAGSLPRLWLN